MKVLIVANGDLRDENLLHERYKWADLVVSADGGSRHLKKTNLKPHVILGDFDSAPGNVIESFMNDNSIEVFTFPVKKDYTDLELAINIAIERGATEIAVLGAFGTRMDHTFANVFLLYKLLKHGIKGSIEDENNRVYLIDNKIEIKKQENFKVSLLSLSPLTEGVSTKGLLYQLDDDVLEFGTSFGVSNEFVDDIAVITVKKGILLVFVSKD
jgi:thiamine pyrophosphokinase